MGGAEGGAAASAGALYTLLDATSNSKSISRYFQHQGQQPPPQQPPQQPPQHIALWQRLTSKEWKSQPHSSWKSGVIMIQMVNIFFKLILCLHNHFTAREVHSPGMETVKALSLLLAVISRLGLMPSSRCVSVARSALEGSHCVLLSVCRQWVH